MPRKPAVPGVDRRQQILEAALSIFADQGFEAATNKAINERAGVNQGLIYFYFSSKADVFFATFEYHARLVIAQLDTIFEQAYDEEPATGLARLLGNIVRVLDTPCAINLLRIMHQVSGSRAPGGALSSQESKRSISMLAEHIGRQLYEYLKTQMARGALRPVKAGLAAYLMTSTLLSSIGTRGQSRQGEVPQQELADMIASLFCDGLLPRETDKGVS